MIDANIFCERDSYAVNIYGHAGFAPKGQDIVCAGVSALAEAFLKAVVHIITPENTDGLRIETGDGLFVATIKKGKDERINNMLWAMLAMLSMGLESIENQYPKYLTHDWINVPDGVLDNDTSEQTMNVKREEVRG